MQVIIIDSWENIKLWGPDVRGTSILLMKHLKYLALLIYPFAVHDISWSQK